MITSGKEGSQAQGTSSTKPSVENKFSAHTEEQDSRIAKTIKMREAEEVDKTYKRQTLKTTVKI